MGKAFSKEEVIVNQNGEQSIEHKLNQFGIMIMVITAMLTLVVAYVFMKYCRKNVQNWLRREMGFVTNQPPQVVVRNIQPQPAATGTATSYM